jgi:hypothetical protein
MVASAVRRLWTRPRVSRLRATHSYGFVLGLVFASFLFASIANDATWTESVLLLLGCATLAAAVWTSGFARASSPAIQALGIAAAALAVVLPISDRNTLNGVGGIVSGLVLVATIVVIAIGVVDQGQVNIQSVTGAICIYLLLGMMFVFFYGAMANLGSGAFFAQGTDGTRSLRLYFSYVTLATLGYGDYTPAGDFGRTVAVVEALLGQLYLVTVVAVLVARLGHMPRKGQ